MPQRLPFSVLTGGLGSGKTTLLARLLRHPAMARTGVVVNEYGEIALDAVLLGHADCQTVVLAGGCVCCLALGDFVAAIRSLEARAAAVPFERVVIETGGLADPLPILQALTAAPDLARRYVPGTVIATVDPLLGEAELSDHLIERQIALADRLVVTKGDLALAGALPGLLRRLSEINPSAELVVATRGDVTPEQVFGLRPDRPLEGGPHQHGPAPRAICLTLTEPVDWGLFGPALERLMRTPGVLRVKGLLQLAEADRPLVVQAVRGVPQEPVWLSVPDAGDDLSRLVFIAVGFDEAAIRAALPIGKRKEIA
jgi:G3E family GTPase